MSLSGRAAVNQKSGHNATTSAASHVKRASRRSLSSEANSVMQAITASAPDTMPIRLRAWSSDSPNPCSSFAARMNSG